jgi:hypothetical protein
LLSLLFDSAQMKVKLNARASKSAKPHRIQQGAALAVSSLFHLLYGTLWFWIGFAPYFIMKDGNR